MIRKYLAAALAALTMVPAVMLGAASPAAGAAGDTHVVNTTDDLPDDDLGDGVCAAASGQCTLRAALEQAQADHEDGVTTTVEVPAGTFVLTMGQLHLYNVNVVVQGAGAGQTIVTVDPEIPDRIMELNMDGELIVTLEDMTFRGGSNELAGAIFNQGGTLTIRRMHFEDNVAAVGGAIASWGATEVNTLIVEDTTFSGNSADWAGGAIHLGSDENATITNSTFTDNQASYGAAIAVGSFETPGGGNLTARHSTFSGNRARGAEGDSSSGGAIAVNDGTVTLIGNILEDTTERDLLPAAPGDPIANCVLPFDQGTITSGGYNVVSDDSCNTTATGDQPNTVAGAEGLADNGGPTLTMAIAADSPAVDAGGATCDLTADQRGIARPQDGDGDGTNGCDSGAFELAGVEVPVTPTPTPTPPAAQPVTASPTFTG